MLPVLRRRRSSPVLSLLALLLASLFSLPPLGRADPAAPPRLTPANSALYIAGRDGKAVLRCDGTTGARLGILGAGMSPAGMALGPDRNLYVISHRDDSIQRFRLSTSKALGTFIPRRRGHLASPLMLAFGRDRNLYVGNRENSDIRRYDGRTGAFLARSSKGAAAAWSSRATSRSAPMATCTSSTMARLSGLFPTRCCVLTGKQAPRWARSSKPTTD